MKMKNEVKKKIQIHIRPEDEEKTKEERNDEKDRLDRAFIEFRSR
jgi:hypothetical protein